MHIITSSQTRVLRQTHSQNSMTEDVVRFPDVTFSVTFPLCTAVRLTEERSTHLSVCREPNRNQQLKPWPTHGPGQNKLRSFRLEQKTDFRGSHDSLVYSRSVTLTCVPRTAAGGPGERISETVDEVQQGPGQDKGIHSGVKLDY